MQGNSTNLFGQQPVKRCARCKQTLPLSNFSFSRKNKGYGKQWPCTYCKPCAKIIGKAYYAATGGDSWWKSNLRRKYGITQEQYQALFDAQGGRCAICRKTQSFVRGKHRTTTRLSVDHHHSTSRKIRGLLCNNCNRAIGLFEDDAQLLKAALDYLLKHS